MRKAQAVIFAVICGLGAVMAQTTADTRTAAFGGKFQSMRPEQRELLRKWVVEYNRIHGRNLTAKRVYEDLPASYKTTYDAVTNALLSTQLTDEQGKPLGTALSLIEVVETIHGNIPGTRGDHQYRIYVFLKENAIDKLYAAREFKRIGDNTVYHKGYPINFRQVGGAPSIQISVTRTGRRADIDVDYRSSAAYAALFNGHLTSANSDVRAGTNYTRHTSRWTGLLEWWKNLLGRLSMELSPAADPATSLDAPDKPRINASQGIHEAIKDFYESWLVKQKPLDAAAYLSVKSYPCIVEFQDGSKADSPLAKARIVKQMRDANAMIGRINNLGDAIQGVALYAPGAQPVKHPYGKLFALELLSDETAYEMDCRIRLKLQMAEEIPRPAKGFSNYYGSILRFKSSKYNSMVLFQVWSKEGNEWRLVTWHFDYPFRTPEVPRVPAKPEPATMKAASPAGAKAVAPADEGLARRTRDFMTAWLLQRDIDRALAYLRPATLDCAAEELELFASSQGDHQQRIQDLFTQVAREAGQGKALSDLLTAPDFSQDHIEQLQHAEGKAYILARISDELAAMYQCGNRATGRRYGKEYAQGEPTFSRNLHASIFQLKRAGESAAALTLIWEQQGSDWKVVAFDIVSY